MATANQVWNFGDIIDATAAALTQDRPAFVHEGRTIMWSDMDRRTNNLARAFLDRGLKPGDRVAFYHRNGVEYGELLVACFKARLVHVNINYRYRDEELLHILDDSGAALVSFDEEFADMIRRLRPRASSVKEWMQTGSAPTNDTLAYETLADHGDGAPLDIERAGDDTLMIYTGGTTGMPKGVVWTHQAMRAAQLSALAAIGPAPATMDDHRAFVAGSNEIKPFMPACPWMHGTGLSTAVSQICFAQPIVTVDSKVGLNPDGIWKAAADHRVHQIAIVGDAFAKPMLAALDSMDNAPDLSGLAIMISSGAMWSREVKEEMLDRIPQLIIADMFGASETLAYGATFSTKENITDTAKIVLTANTTVLKEDNARAKAGETGLIAIKGTIGEGYFGDREKTDKTYRMIDGERWCIPGDWAEVCEDGSVILLGRGSNCINTAGEKVFPEEVEEVLKRADGVKDALVVGVPDEKWGNAVVAVVTSDSLYHGDTGDEETLRGFVSDRLARYKSPKRIFFTAQTLRGPNGKADYQAARQIAETGAAG